MVPVQLRELNRQCQQLTDEGYGKSRHIRLWLYRPRQTDQVSNFTLQCIMTSDQRSVKHQSDIYAASTNDMNVTCEPIQHSREMAYMFTFSLFATQQSFVQGEQAQGSWARSDVCQDVTHRQSFEGVWWIRQRTPAFPPLLFQIPPLPLPFLSVIFTSDRGSSLNIILWFDGTKNMN
jgi:uncharacterized protein YfiM (DUF2279 family)